MTGISRDVQVLVVEDEPRMRELLERAMRGWGFEVTTARSGEEAMRQLAEAVPDVVVLDLNLPGVDGLDFFSRFRERYPIVQGIVLTGFASLESARRAVHLDVVEFLTKPCHLGELEQALDRAIKRLPAPMGITAAPPAPRPGTQGMTLNQLEREHILAALDRNNGNRTATALELGISRRTLYYKLEEYQKQGLWE
ncbi:MAG TPA: response regulator [Tepidisphaeraceae bacterium]|nr:response regulator [Tepidisphaeraceae bacterium]